MNRVALIGVGDTAGWRARALRASGLTITAVASRPESTRVEEFARSHGIPRTLPGWRELLDAADLYDGIAISTWPDGTPEVLAAAMKLGIPVLVEKPVAWSSSTLSRLVAAGHSKVIVGYNRRFYPSVQAAREEAQDGPPVLAFLSLPKEVPVPAERTDDTAYLKPFFESVSMLGLDLTRYVLGDLRIEAVHRLCTPAGNLAGVGALLATARGDRVQLSSAWSAAGNFSLTLDRPGRRCELLPFEVMNLYEGMEVQQPTPEYPIRRYLPKRIRQVMMEGIDLVEKPGFVAETNALRAMMAGEDPPPAAARLADALAVTTLAEELTGVAVRG